MHPVHRISLAAGLLGLAAAAHAQDDTGWYLGIGVGASNFSGDIPAQIGAAYANNNTYVVQSARMTDDGDTASQIFVGYKFLPWLGAELGYQDLGNARSLYVLKTKGPIIYPTPTLNGNYGLEDVNATLVASVPLGERFELLARAGVSATRLSYDEQGFDINAQPYAFHARKRNNTGAIAGIGAAWHFTPHFTLRLDLDRNFDIGDTFALNVTGNGHFDHVDAYTLNLVWKP